MKSKIILILLALYILPLASAGLSVNPSNVFVNKSVGVNQTLVLTITNNETFAFENITFENNPYIRIPATTIGAGQSAQVTATIFSDNNFIGNLKLKGYYNSNLGKRFANFVIDVNYTTGLSICDYSIIEGDSITWINNVLDNVKQINSITQGEVTEIVQGGNYTSNFETPETFSYYFNRRGFQFTDVCTITALDDNGLVTNPDYDTTISLNLQPNYPPTNILMSFVQTSYSLNPFSSTEGVLSITNTGSNPAKSVFLSGDWISSFSANNFDLALNETRGIIYTISPVVSSTSDTNKSYTKTLTANGNFPTASQNLNIFLNYIVVNNGTIGSSLTILDVILQFCEDNPSDSICSPQTIVLGGNGTQNKFNVTMSEEQMREFFLLMFEERDERSRLYNLLKEETDSIRLSTNGTNSKITSLEQQQLEEQQRQARNETIITAIISIATFSVLCGIVGIMIYIQSKKKKLEEIAKW